jgi:excisionase family DNA binding protein
MSTNTIKDVIVTIKKTYTIKDVIVTIKKIDDYLKVTERTIYRLEAAKQMPAFKIGDIWRVSFQDTDSWIKHQTEEALAEIQGK